MPTKSKKTKKRGQPSKEDLAFRSITIPIACYEKLLKLKERGRGSMCELAAAAINALR